MSYCGDLVRQHDPDRFLISMFAPAQAREALWTLFAFNHEIAKTREVVSETTLGLIRLQWWRDALKDIYEGKQVPEHEILKPLAQVIAAHNLPKEEFDALIYAREFDLEDVMPGNIEGLLNYADFTTTPLLRLAVRICGDDPDQHVIQPIAVNYTLAGVLRGTAFLVQNGRVLLPEDLMKKHGLNKDNIFAKDKHEDLKIIIKASATACLDQSKPKHVVLRASEAMSDVYFNHLRTHNFDVLSPNVTREPFLKVLRVWYKSRII